MSDTTPLATEVPIPFDPPAPDDLVVRGTDATGEHIIIIPLTAGAAGAANTTED